MKKTLLISALSLVLATPAFAVIPDGWNVTPGEGATVEKIETIVISKSTNSTLDTYVNRSVKINGESIAVTEKVSNTGWEITLTLATPVVKSGKYEIIVPKGTFDYDYNAWSEEGTQNPEMSWNVTVNNPDEQPVENPEVNVTADPVSGRTVSSLESVTLTFDGVQGVSAGTAAAIISSMGTPLADVSVSLEAGTAANTMVAKVSPAVVKSGEYTITFPDAAFSYTATGVDPFSSKEFKLNYTVKAPLADGECFIADKIRYKVISAADKTVEVTFPKDGISESDYAPLTTVPLTTEYEGDTYNVIAIGRLAFSEVSGLADFVVPEGITLIGEGAFWESTLSSISIPASVVSIENDAFQDCKQLKAFTLPSTVENIGTGLFYGCAQLEDVSLPQGMTTIPEETFAGCAMMKSIDIPSSVTTIGEFAFSECAELTEVTIPEGCTTLNRFAFAYCAALKSLPVPESVTTIGNGVFYSCGLTEASLPDNFTTLPDGFYQCCADLKEFEIGDKVTSIEQQAFYWCFALESITLGKNVKTIGSEAFKGDRSLKTVISMNPVPPTGAVFEKEVYDGANLIVPTEAEEAYKAADGWKEFKNFNGSVGVEGITVGAAGSIMVDGHTISASGSHFTVIAADGSMLYSGSGSFTVTSSGVYLVKTAEKSLKVII